MGTTLELLVAVIVQIVEQVLPKLVGDQTASVVDIIITTLQKILPDVLKAGEQLATTVQNIIAALKGTDGVTQPQWDALDALEKQIDPDFDAAAKDEGF